MLTFSIGVFDTQPTRIEGATHPGVIETSKLVAPSKTPAGLVGRDFIFKKKAGGGSPANMGCGFKWVADSKKRKKHGLWIQFPGKT